MADAQTIYAPASGASIDYPSSLVSFSSDLHHAPAANTAAVVTIAADASRPNIVSQVFYSYSAAPTGGSLIITDGGTEVFKQHITAAGPGQVDFVPPLKGASNSAVVVTIAAGGGVITGTCTVNAWKET